MDCLTAWGQWTVQLLSCTATVTRVSGPWNSCNALRHRLGVVGGGTPVIHCLTAQARCSFELLQCTA